MTDDNGDDVTPQSHREIDEQSSRVNAYACTCTSAQQQSCAYHRMGYCSDRVHGVEAAKFKRPTLVIDNSDSNVIKLRR